MAILAISSVHREGLRKLFEIEEYNSRPIMPEIMYMANRPITRFTASTYRTNATIGLGMSSPVTLGLCHDLLQERLPDMSGSRGLLAMYGRRAPRHHEVQVLR